MNDYQELVEYLSTVLGSPPRLEPLSEERVAVLPLYLRSSYKFAHTRLYDTDIVFAFSKVDPNEVTPTTYASEHVTIERTLRVRVALVLPGIQAYKRNRLVQNEIPFVVPNRQLFLPTLFVNLSETFPSAPRRMKHLSASTQTVVLYYLLGNQTTGVKLQELASTLGYSAMTLSNTHKELEDLGFAETDRDGKSLSIRFTWSRHELWDVALERMTSPVQKKLWVSWKTPLTGALVAGTSALARMTLLGQDQVVSYAVHAPQWKKAMSTSHVRELRSPDDADAKIEQWRYNPRVLSKSELVDPLSIYLSLRDSSDERVQSALDQLLKGMKW